MVYFKIKILMSGLDIYMTALGANFDGSVSLGKFCTFLSSH